MRFTTTQRSNVSNLTYLSLSTTSFIHSPFSIFLHHQPEGDGFMVYQTLHGRYSGRQAVVMTPFVHIC